MRYLIALLLTFAIYTTSSAQQCPGGKDAQQEQSGEQRDFGMEEQQEPATQPGAEKEGEMRGEQRDYGAEAEGEVQLQDPEVIYSSDDNKLKVKEATEGNIIINYNPEATAADEAGASGRVEGYGMEGEAGAETRAEEFETAFQSDDQNVVVKEHPESGELRIEYKQQEAGKESQKQQQQKQQHEGMHPSN